MSPPTSWRLLLLFVLLLCSVRFECASARLGASILEGASQSASFDFLNGWRRHSDDTIINDDDDEFELLPIRAHEYDSIPLLNATDTTSTSTSNTKQFIVRFNESLTHHQVTEQANEAAHLLGGTVQYIYRHVFNGASIQVDITHSNNNMASVLSSDLDQPNSWPFTLEPDQGTMGEEITAQSTGTGATVRVQEQAPSQLDRLNQRSMPLDGTYDYTYDGSGVTVYVMDTGVRTSHNELAHVNVTCGFNAIAETEDCDDYGGHGTHVAGSIASRTYGVAKGVRLVSVKVLDQYGRGSYSGILAGLDYIMAQQQIIMAATRKSNGAATGRGNQTLSPPMIINMSLGGVKSVAVNDATNRAVAAGIVVIVAAGNSESDACHASPSSAEAAITVGASQPTRGSRLRPRTSWLRQLLPKATLLKRDRRATYSNFGACVDIFAWGTNVLSLGIADNRQLVSRSGTSMATPHVTGAVAMYLHRDPTLTPEQVKHVLLSDASADQLVRVFQKKSPNLMVNTHNIR